MSMSKALAVNLIERKQVLGKDWNQDIYIAFDAIALNEKKLKLEKKNNFLSQTLNK